MSASKLAGLLVSLSCCLVMGCSNAAHDGVEPLEEVPEASGDDLPVDSPSPRSDPGSTDSWLDPDSGAFDTAIMAEWMRGRRYREWASTSGVFPSAEGGSRVFINDVLAESLANPSGVHPVGAVGIRELYLDDLVTPRAINLLLKTGEGDDSDGSQWFWVEVTNFSHGAAPSIEEPAALGCVGCHSGHPDFIQSTWPLR